MTTKPLEARLGVWQFFVKTYGLFYITLVAPWWLSAQAVQECIENQLTNSYVCSLGPFYELKLQILLLTVLLSLPINDLPYFSPCFLWLMQWEVGKQIVNPIIHLFSLLNSFQLAGGKWVQMHIDMTDTNHCVKTIAQWG